MTDNQGQGAAGEKPTAELDKGPTEKLRDLERSTADTLIPGTEIPGAQDPDSNEIKNEQNVNTE